VQSLDSARVESPAESAAIVRGTPHHLGHVELGRHRSRLRKGGEDGLGEATLTGKTFATEVSRGEEREVVYRPEDFGLAVQSLDSARVESPAESAAIVRGVLGGKPGAARNIVILNAACGLITVDPALQPPAAAKRAAEAIDSGAAGELLQKLAALSHAG